MSTSMPHLAIAIAAPSPIRNPLDPTRIVSPLVTGLLPPATPPIARGQVYCIHDFRQRAVAWFATERNALAAGTTSGSGAADKTRTPERTPERAPTRIQPARAAKRKATLQLTTQPASKKLRSTASASAPARAPTSSYTLLPAFHTASLVDFKARLDALIDAQRLSLLVSVKAAQHALPPWPPASSDFAPSRSPNKEPKERPDDPDDPDDANGQADPTAWCPVVAEPLACVDRAYCLHSVGRPPSVATASSTSKHASSLLRALAPAPEACMTPPQTPPPVVLRPRRKEFAAQRHVQDRTVTYAGLRFAVDVCSGAVRVWMV